MKRIKLNINNRLATGRKVIKYILDRNIDAFKSTKWQFLRNNQAYHTPFTGLIA